MHGSPYSRVVRDGQVPLPNFTVIRRNQACWITSGLPIITGQDSGGSARVAGHLNSAAYFWDISLINLFFDGCLGGTPAGLQGSWKKPSRPARHTTQSRRTL